MSQKCGKSIDFLILFSSDTNCGFALDTFSCDKICTYLHKGGLLQLEIIFLILKNKCYEWILMKCSGNVEN